MKRFVLILVFAVGIGGCVWGESRHSELTKNLDIFYSVMRELDMYYVDSLNYEKLVEKAINSMLSNLDPYTVYFPESKGDVVKKMTSGEYGGVGAVIQQHGQNVYIEDPYEGLPAFKAGLKCGDLIVSIDGDVMLGQSVSKVSERLRGDAGSKLVVEVKREGEKKNLKVEITREVIRIHPVRLADVIGDSVGYILFTDFTEDSFVEFKSALQGLQQRGIRGLIIDLRGNGGGLIGEAVDIASLFVPYGTEIVSTKGRGKEESYVYKTRKMPIAQDLPLAILVDDETASASEILAGAMQDLDRAVIVGERTYGKGLVQNIRSTDHSSYLKVTIGKYYIPSGRCVQAIDYSHRNENGSVGKIPDSLTHVFHTKKGREVRDGGGILPDSIVVPEEKNKSANFLFYLYNNNYLFEYANVYAAKYKGGQIATPDVYCMSDEDYADFKEFVKTKNPSYHLRSEEVLKSLEEIVKWEGYEEAAKDDFATLKAKLTPNLENDLDFFKEDIVALLNYEIVKRFYYQKGCARYSLRNDKVMEKALETLKK